jgi:hypothetical protein
MNKTSEQVVELVDANGRVIPKPRMKGVVNPGRSFDLTQPPIDYATCLARLREFYGGGMKFMSVAEFGDRCAVAIEGVGRDSQIANLLKGPHFPFVIPQLDAGDLGNLLDGTIVPAMGRSYTAQFPQREFHNPLHGRLGGYVRVAADTRQERLVKSVREGSVCGVYFPALKGFNFAACREIIGGLPQSLLLSGMEVLAAVTAYPEILGGRDDEMRKRPSLVLAGLNWVYPAEYYSFVFQPFRDSASFASLRPHIVEVDDFGGVSVLG